MFGSTISGSMDPGQKLQSLDAGARWGLLEVITYFGIPYAIVGPGGDASQKRDDSGVDAARSEALRAGRSPRVQGCAPTLRANGRRGRQSPRSQREETR